jgi:aldose 1-epimerase
MAENRIARESRDGVDVVTLESGEATAKLVPEWGSNLFELTIGESVLEPVAWDALAAKPTSFGIPILFPYPNRVRDSRFTFGDRRFEVSPVQHGYVRQRPWRLVDAGASTAEGAWAVTAFDAGEHEDVLAQFPFRFRLEARHTLRDRALELRYTIASLADEPFPFGFGLHPYFRRPRTGRLRVPAAARWELDEKLPTGRIVPVEGAFDLRSGADLADLELDDILTSLDADDGGRVRCAVEDLEAGTRTVVEFEREPFPNVVVYTAPAPRSAICVEPMTVPTDAFNLQARGVDANVTVLEPAGSRALEVRIAVEPL